MSAYELHALEYERRKEEQVRRIGLRDNLIYVAVTAMAAIFGFAIQDHHRLHLLLAVCPAAVVLSWTYLANDQKITAIGRECAAQAPRRTRWPLRGRFPRPCLSEVGKVVSPPVPLRQFVRSGA
ncbi:hypothetical protein ACIF70_40425 [Actinacidiphila glaucinigra]|uniref:hypothetical protein n=1 Tax=Actinacidiphila glaucinigra TaxID=235986 RepID=UPI0037C74142